MKKLIAILSVLMVLAGVAFATNNDQLIITANVPEIKPVFSIYGGTSSEAITTLGTQSGATVATNINISTTDAKVYIKLTQAASTYAGAATLTITPTVLANTANGLTSYTTALPTVANYVEGKGSVSGITIANPTVSNSVVSYSLTYVGTPVAAGSVIGTFDYTWAKVPSLPVGTYQATITLTYTPQ